MKSLNLFTETAFRETDEEGAIYLQIRRQNFTSAATADADVFKSYSRLFLDGAVGVRVLLNATRDGAQHLLDEAARLVYHIVAAGNLVKFLAYIVIEAHELDDHAVAVHTAQRGDHFDDGRTALEAGGHLRQLLGSGNLQGQPVHLHQRHQLVVLPLVLLGPSRFETLLLLPPPLLLGHRSKTLTAAAAADAADAAAAAASNLVSSVPEWKHWPGLMVAEVVMMMMIMDITWKCCARSEQQMWRRRPRK